MTTKPKGGGVSLNDLPIGSMTPRDRIAARAQDRNWNSGPTNGGGSRRFTKGELAISVSYVPSSGALLDAKLYDGPSSRVPIEQVRATTARANAEAQRAKMLADVLAWFDRTAAAEVPVVDIDPPPAAPELAPEPVAPAEVLNVRIGGELLELVGPQVARFKAAQRDTMLTYPTDAQARSTALRAAVRYLRGEATPAEVGDDLAEARQAERAAVAAARTVGLLSLEDGAAELATAKALGVDRMTVRKWRGKA